MISSPEGKNGGMRTIQLGLGWFAEQSGGLNRFYGGLVRHLPDAGVEVRGLVTGSPAVARETKGQVEGFVATDAALPVRALSARRAMARLLDTDDIDLVASHFALYTLPSLDRLRRMPFVVHFHGPWSDESGFEANNRVGVWIKAAVETAVYGRAQRIIVLSQAFGTILEERFGIPGDRIRIVPGGIDPSICDKTLSQKAARERLGWPADRPIVVTVRRLARRMGLENLIEAVTRLRQAVPDILLVIGGAGYIGEELRRMIDERGLGNHVWLAGYVADEDLPMFYRAADLSVVPTIALEGFGLTTIESMANGTPVLVTPVGGLPEVIQALSPNLILEGSAAEQIADGLKSALLDRTALPNSDACRAYVRDNFAWPLIAAKTRGVYEEALA